MAPAFTSGKDLLEFDGFKKVEVHVSTQFEDYDEMQVMMYWDTKEQFEVWRNSDAFKNAHKGGGGDSEHSPVISSQIVIAEVLAELAK